MIVIDASVLAPLLLEEPAAVQGLGGDLPDLEDQPLHAPEVVELETLNMLRGLVRSRQVTELRSAAAIRALGRARLVRYPHGPFRERIWSLRHNLTAYDASYLALAEALPGSLLLTADCGLAKHARALLGAERVRRIG